MKLKNKSPKLASSGKNKKIVKKKKSTEKKKFHILFGIGPDREYFVEMLSMLVGSGMDIILILESIKSEVKTRVMKLIIGELISDIQDGNPLWKSLNRTRLLSDHVIALIRVGEESGRLQENLQVISEQQKKDRIFKSRIRSAMMYPVFVILLTVVVGLGISWFIMPRFVRLFTMVDKELPLLTKILVWLGNVFASYGAIIVPGTLIGLVIVLYFVFIYKRTKGIGQWLLFHFPITKRLIQEIEISRFGYILGTLLNAGLPIVDALEALGRSTTYHNYKKLYIYLKAEIQDGNSFMNALQNFKRSKKMISTSLQQMIGSAEKSGFLADSLERIGSTYELKTELTAKNLTTMLEPVLLVVIGLAVLGVALAVIVPIYGLLDTFNSV
jgi:type IV pilus assembly protein PilC